MNAFRWRFSLASIVLFASSTAFADYIWRFGGNDLHNTASSPGEYKITPQNASMLTGGVLFDGTGGVPCVIPGPYCPDILSAPAVYLNTIYVADMAGNLRAINKDTGAVIWSKNLQTDYSNPGITKYAKIMKGLKVRHSRGTPAIVDGLLILGGYRNVVAIGGIEETINDTTGAVMLGINRFNGDLVWATQIDNHPLAGITQSPVANILNNTVYIGVSTPESFSITIGLGTTTGNPIGRFPYPYVTQSGDIYKCCTFRGSVVALNALTGKIKWRTMTVPSTPAEKADWRVRPTGPTASWSGNSVWGSTGAIDLKRNLLYIGTGQTHTLPLAVAQANNLVYDPNTGGYNGTPTVPQGPPGTSPSVNLSASIVALDLDTGAVKWSKQFGKLNGFDAWNASCIGEFAIILPWGIDVNTSPFCPPHINFVDMLTPDPADLTSVFPQIFYNLEQLNNPFDFYSSSGGVAPIPPNGPIPTNAFAPVAGVLPYGGISWDHDFGQGPMFVNNVKMPNGKYKDLIIAAQKLGIARAIDADTKAVVWATFEGPGGAEGGYEFGSSTDGKRVYLANNRGIFGSPTVLKDGTITSNAYWSALDIATGAILWETKVPDTEIDLNPLSGQSGPASMRGMTSVANGVMFGVVGSTLGSIYALDAATGQILLQFPTTTDSVNQPSAAVGRVTIVDGEAYFGAGNSNSEFGSTMQGAGNGKLYKLSLPANCNN